ncbi:hypothetical protein FIU88_08335 [Halomonas sp. THAF12]|uniref:hypothetical protein n=1 Tax=Halomonas sp. THAF12 TaxID=2587849 RepID=UPI001268AD8B|nr:hypothetical protein [Halomonas sp. THAF12]QFT84982.1 hypothetical protein FIU88_08335 [Halomonas sp. THAF12]
MNTVNLKSSIGFAISMFGALSSGVGMASVEATHYAVHQVPTAHKQESRRSERAHIMGEIVRANRRARHLAQIFQNECVRLSQMPDDAVVDPEAYQGLVDALRDQEVMLKRIIEIVGRDEAEDMGIMELRRYTARARSAASNATLLAKQTVNKPRVVEGVASGEGMKALADRFDDELSDRFS